MYYLGKDGRGLSKVASMSIGSMCHRGISAIRMNDPNLIKPLASIAVLPASESSTLHLLAITNAGKGYVGVIGKVWHVRTFGIVCSW